MSDRSYEESVQHRCSYRAIGSTPTEYALVKKKKPLPVIVVSEHISFDPKAKTYHVRINRRLFKRNSPSFETLKAAIEWRDAELVSAPKGEKGRRCCILKNKPL